MHLGGGSREAAEGRFIPGKADRTDTADSTGRPGKAVPDKAAVGTGVADTGVGTGVDTRCKPDKPDRLGSFDIPDRPENMQELPDTLGSKGREEEEFVPGAAEGPS